MTDAIRNWSLSPSNKGNLYAKIDALDFSLGYVVNISLRKTSRSIEQNSRLWKLYTELGNHIGHTPDEVHTLMGYKFLRYQTIVNGETVEAITSTTKLNTAEMAEYQSNIEMWAAEIGFYFHE